jgi:membrane associated rhomboid family serine protease
MHLLGNMITKWLYGWSVDRRHGWLNTLCLYTVSSTAGVLFQYVLSKGYGYGGGSSAG